MGESEGTSAEWHERPEEKNDVGSGAQENCRRATRQVGQGEGGEENGVREYAADPSPMGLNCQSWGTSGNLPAICNID